MMSGGLINHCNVLTMKHTHLLLDPMKTIHVFLTVLSVAKALDALARQRKVTRKKENSLLVVICVILSTPFKRDYYDIQ